VEKARQDEFFKKIDFMKQEFHQKSQNQIKELEDVYSQREQGLIKNFEETYKLKESAIQTRYDYLEKNYNTLLVKKAMDIEDYNVLTEHLNKLKGEIEEKNRELNEKIQNQDNTIQSIKDKCEIEYNEKKKELEESYSVKLGQIESERSKLKNLLTQEEQIVSELRKREISLQENFARKETELMKELQEIRERLEKEYQEKLKEVQELKKKIEGQ
jgi:chromosome segregation ATPase